MFMGAIASTVLAVTLLWLGVVFISAGLWLTNLGLHRLRIVSVHRPHEGQVRKGPRWLKAKAVSTQPQEDIFFSRFNGWWSLCERVVYPAIQR